MDCRLAPAYPFATGMEDGGTALLYLQSHAPRHSVDLGRIALSGFSAGGNMALTIPLPIFNQIGTRASVKACVSQTQLYNNEKGKNYCTNSTYPRTRSA